MSDKIIVCAYYGDSNYEKIECDSIKETQNGLALYDGNSHGNPDGFVTFDNLAYARSKEE